MGAEVGLAQPEEAANRLFPFFVALVVVSVLAVAGSTIIAYRHRERSITAGACLVIGAAFWLLMDALGLASDSLSIKLSFHMMTFVGVSLVPSGWLVLAMLISGYERYVKRYTIIALSVVPLLTLLLEFTKETHSLIYANVSLNAADPYLPLSMTFGLGYWILVVWYSYVLLLVGLVIFVRRAIVSRRAYRSAAVQLLLVATIPWALNAAFVFNPSLFGYYEPASFAISVTGIVLLWKLTSFPLMNVVPVAHEMVVDGIDEAIIVLDGLDHIVDANPKAQDLLGCSLSQAGGRSIEEVWTEWPALRKVLGSETETRKEVTLGNGMEQRVYEAQTSTVEGLVANLQCRLIVLRNITERKRMEEKLRESEDRFRGIAERSFDAIILTDLEGRITYASPAVERITGYGRNELLGASFQKFLPESEISKGFRLLSQALEGEMPESVEANILRKDGSIACLEFHASLILMDGKLAGFQGIARDITERKQMESELRRHSEHLEEVVLERTRKLAESESRFRELADLLPQPVFEIDNEAKFTFVNRAGFALTGYTEEEVRRGVNALDLVVPEDRERLAEIMMRVLGGENTRGNEFTAVRKDGGTFPVFVNGVRVMKEDEIVGFRAIAIDISERKRMEEALRESGERLRTIFDSMSAGIMVIDPKMHVIVDANPAAIEMVGAPKDQILGSICHKYLCPAEKEHCPITDLGRTVDNAEGVLLRVDGKTASIIKSVYSIVLGGREHLLESFIDITERKRMEEELVKSQRMATIGELAGMVGHDLRNPLQGITVAAHYLRTAEGPKLSGKGKEMLQFIEADIARSDKIIGDLLEYSRELHLELSETDAKSIAKDALVHLKIPATICVVDSTQNETKMILDAEKMRRVFLNLLQNAIDAMPEGGTLTITSKRSNGRVEIAFRDTGVGMTEETIRKLWNPLYTTKAKGMGFGLAISRRVVEAHGGSINVESRPGEGSTFTVILPIRETKRESVG